MMLCCKMSCEHFAGPAGKSRGTHVRLYATLEKVMITNVLEGGGLLVSAAQLQQLQQQPTRLLDSGDVLAMDEDVEGDHLQETNDKEDLRPLA